MNQSDYLQDLTLALMAQNNLLLSLIRTHPNRDILATAFSQAQSQFPEANLISTSDPEKYKFTATTISSFEIAFTTPLDPLHTSGA